jgi:5-methylcytosine-specific restriction endonuclease McrA
MLLDGVDSSSRIFPASWRDAAIRELFDNAVGGVRCARCVAVFCSLAELRTLQADHIVPWSKGGLTTWANMQLLCSPCNRAKWDRIEHQ